MQTPEEKLSKYVKEHRLKSSSQRNVILSFMINNRKHHTVEELYDFIKKDNPEIGIATVYRTIRLLCDAKIVHEIRIGNDETRYEVIEPAYHHDHLLCENCGTFVEISSSIIENEQKKIANKHGFTLTNHSLILYGICQKCSKKR